MSRFRNSAFFIVLASGLGVPCGASLARQSSVCDPLQWLPRQSLQDGTRVHMNTFGFQVAIDQDTTVVLAEKITGQAFIFRRVFDNWVHVQTIIGSYGIRFRDVVIRGDWIALAVDDRSNQQEDQGSVFLYRFDPQTSNWALFDELQDPEGGANPEFGEVVDLSDTYLVVGTWYGTDAAFVYAWDGGAWTFEQKLTVAPEEIDIFALQTFGMDVAVDGDVIVVGAPQLAFAEIDQFDDSAFFVFRRIGGTWSQETRIATPNPSETRGFGFNIRLEGETLLVGNFGHRSPARMYRHDGQAWNLARVFEAPEGVDGAGSLAIDISNGNLVTDGVVVDEQSGDSLNAVLAWQLDDSTGDWNFLEAILPDTTFTYEQFGASLALHDGTLIVGATSSSPNFLFPEEGRAVIYDHLPPLDCNNNGVADLCDITNGVSADTNNNNWPDECDTPGDVNGDRFVTVADLLALLAAWGPCQECAADVNGDGEVTVADLLTLLVNWG